MNSGTDINSTSGTEFNSSSGTEFYSTSGTEYNSETHSETYVDYTPYFDKVISNQQIFIGLFVALVTLAGVGLVINFFVKLFK